MRPVYTLTGNLLAERTLTFPAGWSEGVAQRAAQEAFQVGGKGINVARMLARLGAPVTALAFAGGAAGEECREWLESEGRFRFRFFDSAVPTRTGVVVRSPGRPETTFFAPDRAPDATAQLSCARVLDTLEPDALVALCGSFPGWDDPGSAPLVDVLIRLAAAGRLAVDSYGPPLVRLVAEPVSLVKINRQEFDALWPENARSRPIPERLAEMIQREPVRAWVVTDGSGPVWLAQAGGAVQSFLPPKVTEVSATGSGDVLFAALLHTWFCLRGSLAEAVRRALPLAAANAASAGVADFPLP